MYAMLCTRSNASYAFSMTSRYSQISIKVTGLQLRISLNTSEDLRIHSYLMEDRKMN